ncbi:MAG: electron transport complex subunit RsxB [Limnobacter sp.]|nr:electron transport complex subunit RsxB [Limnobacter sp.]
MVPADAIEALLPQTQCTKCGYSGCRPYAEAIAADGAAINRCPPGGTAGIARLARLLGRPALLLDPACGSEAPRRLARIDPELCIGCTKCIQACPVDAIIGAHRRMHTVIAAQCTGCELCVAPCPVDCIAMDPLPSETPWSDDDAAAARWRHSARRARLERERARREAALAASAGTTSGRAASSEADARRRAAVAKAVERARTRLATIRR